MKMYVNGQPATKKSSYTTTIVPLLDTATTLTIGGNSTETGECTMCDVRVYSHALSAHEIRDISSGLLVHYNFNDSGMETTTNYNVNSG
jgi:aerobic-type carbon monoxide dehydrogenase small subunit (CoxS/CutS family)